MDLRVEVFLRTESYLVFVNGLRGLISRWYQCIWRGREIALDFGWKETMSTKAKYCPHCGETLPESGDSFCNHCGASLIALAAESTCARCQGEIQDTDLYCRHCRHFTSSDA